MSNETALHNLSLLVHGKRCARFLHLLAAIPFVNVNDAYNIGACSSGATRDRRRRAADLSKYYTPRPRLINYSIRARACDGV